ncbi:ATPase family AAA domain-containing protein 2 isoform X2 [Pithys albifrons albifrons]|uniref:ATPase family AAA domain-containing protein 2 isoform X2 n=1 Tax=Pithys albifrons albifrons TaxID=3385563 RepID=UPI003A5D100C
MVVLRSSVARPPRVAARDSRCRRPPFDLLDSSSDFISLEAPALSSSRRIWTRSGSARAARSSGARRAEEAEYSSGNIECFNGHCLRSMRKNMPPCSDSSFDKSMEILSENVNRHFSRQLAKPKSGPKKEDYKEVTRTLKTRADAKAEEQVREANGDLEVRRSCRLQQSRYTTTNESVLFDKLITNTAEAVLQKMDDMEKMRRRRRMGDLEVFHDTEEESLDMERTDEEIADNQVGSSEESEAKEDDGEDTRKRYSFRQRKTVEHYQAPLQKPRKRKMYFPDRSSPVKQRDSRKGTNRRRHTVPSSDSSSSSDDEEDFERQQKNRNLRRSLPGNFRKGDLKGVHKDRMKMGASLADVDPVKIDCSVRFDGVGGLSDHIAALKEMVVFPLLYPEVFERFKIQPPRGCLFYGPPGTGKTLVARALANECSQSDRRVAFFMRKGADCLSKWVGESERQLRLLFDQAYQMRPSIIFFDEIDGLAPVRSSKQDQVHSSVVSTLLALMDGLHSRGEVVVIGATNRLDSIDPALRRPGRFDREFLFSLPNKEARKEIFKIHTRDWTLKPLDKFLEELAEKCVGYCGADIKALCAEAALCALRRRYPQIYERSEKLQLDVTSIKITAKDFAMAMQKTVPASQRAVASPGRALSPILKPLLENTLERILQALQRVFPHSELALKKDQQQGNDVIDTDEESPSIFEERPTHEVPDPEKAEFLTFSRNPRCQPTSFRPRFLLVEDPGCGQAFHLAPAVIHALEKFPVYTLDLPALFVSTTSPEETCAQLMREAQRTAPSILYVPQIPLWWETVGPTVKAVFTTLLQNIPTFAPVLLLATSDVQHGDLPEEIKVLFNNDHEEVFKIQWPTSAERRSFFEDLVMKQAAGPLASKNNAARRPLEVLPVAPPPKPRQLTEEEMRQLEEQEEDTLRELRIYLRDVTHRLVIDRRFRAFTKPVDPEEVPDYNAVIKQPMDLSTVLSKIDMHQYPTARDFLKDIDLICSNALEYNPVKDPGDRLLRHRACALRDTAYSIVREEMDEDFEQRCQEIKESRKQRDKSRRKRKKSRKSLSIAAKRRNVQFNKENKIPEDHNEVESNEESNTDCTEFTYSQDTPMEEHENVLQEQQKNGTENERERVLFVSKSPSEKKRENSDLREQSEMPDCQKAGTSEDRGSNDSWVQHVTRARCSEVEEKQLGCVGKAVKTGTQSMFVDYCELKQVLHSITVITENVSIFRMEKLYAVLSQCIYQHRENGDKNELVKAMKKEITAFGYP